MPVDAAAILFAVPAGLALALRVVALASGILIAGFAAIVLARAGLAFAGFNPASRWMIWLVVAYCALGSVVNAVTPSRRERALWLPVLLLMLGAGIAVGMG